MFFTFLPKPTFFTVCLSLKLMYCLNQLPYINSPHRNLFRKMIENYFKICRKKETYIPPSLLKLTFLFPPSFNKTTTFNKLTIKNLYEVELCMEGGSFIIIKIGEREEGEFMNKKLD